MPRPCPPPHAAFETWERAAPQGRGDVPAGATPPRAPAGAAPARRSSDHLPAQAADHRPRADRRAPASPFAASSAPSPHAPHPWPDAPSSLHEALARPDGRPLPAGPQGLAPPPVPHGLPQDRHARVAAARALIELQQAFRQAIGLLDGLPHRRQLQRQVELARDPAELWLLRRAVLPPLQALGGCAERAIWQLEHSIARSLAQHAPPTA